MSNSSNTLLRPTSWHILAISALAFWFSGSLLLDFVVMPGMAVSGAMGSSEAGTTGYILFWLFNRVELLCGALLLTGLLAMRWQRSAVDVIASGMRSRWALELTVLLCAIAAAYTYLLTPTMAGLGLSLDVFQVSSTGMPEAMKPLQITYWGLEVLKLLASGWLLKLCAQDWGVTAVGTARS